MPQNESERKLLSVVIPVYNELDTWKTLLSKVEEVQLPDAVDMEIVLVDDCSKDGTREQLEEFAAEVESGRHPGRNCRVFFHRVNQGKGAALRTGFREAIGDFVVVQDADLEYDPNDYPRLLEPLLGGQADVVYGSRFLAGRPEGAYLRNCLANKFLTTLSNLSTGLELTDMETCYKMFRKEIIDQVKLTEDRFGVEPEVTANLAVLKARVVEVPIAYQGRSLEEGKKIGWKDGVRAIWCILKYSPRLSRRR